MVGAEEAAWFFYLTAWIGAFTAFLAATQGMVSLELKKVLAYSTVSQIGYMMLGMGVAGLAPGLLVDGYTAAIFHLVNHALFKACLFLCAGTIIHAVHSIYVHDMGATRKYLPLTWGFTVVASLSLIGLPPFPGFWSKDAVLLAALEANLPLFVLALVTVAITAFYTVRFLGIVFFGPESENLLQVKTEGGHLNDGALSMRAASGLLAVLIVVAGLSGPLLEQVLHDGFAASLAGFSAEAVVPAEETASSHGVVPVLSLLFVLAGAMPAYYLFIARRRSPGALLERHAFFQALHTFFWNRWFIDAFYRRVFVDGTLRMASQVASVEDGWDRLVHRKLPVVLTEKLQQTTRRLRTETEELFYNVSYILVLFILFPDLLHRRDERKLMMSTLLLQILMAPICAAAFIFLTRKKLAHLAGWVAALTLLYTTGLVMAAGAQVYGGSVLYEEYLIIAPDVRLGLLADGLSLPTLGVVILLCTALAFYSIRYVEHRVELLYHAESESVQEGYYARFFYLFPFFPVGFIGVILSSNLISLYFFLEVLTITLFFLMAYFGYVERIRVAFISLAWGIIGALFFLAAAVAVYTQVGSFEISELGRMAGNPLITWTIALFLIGLLMKLAIVPFHVWMPWVHAEHPTCIAGLLAVYANLGLYIIIRVLFIPLGGDLQPFGAPLMVLALATMVYGSPAHHGTDRHQAPGRVLDHQSDRVLGPWTWCAHHGERRGGYVLLPEPHHGEDDFLLDRRYRRLHDWHSGHARDGWPGAQDAGDRDSLGDWLHDVIRVPAVQQFHCGVGHVYRDLRAWCARRAVRSDDRDRRCRRDFADGGILVRGGPAYFLLGL